MTHITQVQLGNTAAVLQLPVTAVIPQRSPFLFVDHIIEGEPGTFAISSYEVKPDNPVFTGHFPDFPILPGVLLVENMAQTACWVLAAQVNQPSDANQLYVLARITQCTFRRMVRPHDVLHTRAELSRDLGQFASFQCQVTAGGENVATAELLVARRAAQAQL